jgi:hypothetical protein
MPMAALSHPPHVVGAPSSGVGAVKSMQCLDCGEEGHPKFCHPSSLRAEAAVWAVAIVIGLSAGMWQAVTAPSDTTPSTMSLLSVVTPAAEEASTVTPALQGPRSVIVQIGGWLFDRLTRFLRTAWWALLIPIAFSTWRQGAKRVVCVHCESRRLVPAEPLPYGL